MREAVEEIYRESLIPTLFTQLDITNDRDVIVVDDKVVIRLKRQHNQPKDLE